MRFPGVSRRSGPTDPPRPRGRWRRWVLRGLLGLVALVALAVVAVLVALHSLDRPWLKRRIQAAAHGAGVELEYQAIDVGVLSGITIEGVVVQSPAEVRAFAPDLVRIGRIDARWTLGTLLGGPVRVRTLNVSDVALAVVIDEHGRTSFDALFPGPAAPSGPPTPLSHQASSFLTDAIPLGEIALKGIALELIRTTEGKVSERSTLGGLAAAVDAMSAEPGARGQRVKLALGSLQAPLELHLTRERDGAPAGDARAKLWVAVDATSLAVSAALELRAVEQTFGPSVAVDHWLHAEAKVAFDPVAGKTLVTVDHTTAADGAATVEAVVELPDNGDPLVRHAEGDIDVDRLLTWAPAGMVPATAERAQVRYKVDSLGLGKVVALADGGSANVDVDLGKVSVAAAAGPMDVATGAIALHAQPAPGGGIAARGTIKLTGLGLAAGGAHLALDDLAVDLDGQQAKDGIIDAKVGVTSSRIVRDGATPVAVKEAKVHLQAQGLAVNTDDPLATHGDVTLALDVASIDARTPTMHALVDGLAARLHAPLAGHTPYAAELDVPVRRVQLLRGDAVLADAPVHLDMKLHDVFPNLPRPAASRGIAHVALDLADVQTTLDATKGEGALDYVLHTAAPSLKAARPFLPPDLARKAPWDQMGVTLQSKGRVESLVGGEPRIDHTTEIDLSNPAFEDVSARAVVLKIASKGTALQHEANVDLAARALVVQGSPPGDDHLTLGATVDRLKPSFTMQMATEGRAVVKLTASASFDAARHAIPYAIDAHFAGLGPLAPFLAKVHGLDAFDVAQLGLAFSSSGAVVGAVSSVKGDGTVLMAPQPNLTAGVEGEAAFKVDHLHWTHGDVDILSPSFAWHGKLHADGAKRSVESHLEIDSAHLDLGTHEMDLGGVRDDTTLTAIGDLADPLTEIAQHLAVRSLEQDAVPEYPVGNVTFSVEASRDRDGLIHVADLKLANGAGGTTVGLTGNVEVGSRRRTLSVTTSLTQDLEPLNRTPGRFVGKGHLAMEANVTSPDFILMRVRAALKASDVTVKMPRAGVDLETVNGEIPITVALEVGSDGVALHPDEKRSHYSMLRFADQHPLLSRNGFLSIASITTPWVSIAPLVGNLEIEQNVISLRQFEMGVRNGSITGQCGLDWDGPKSTLELHVRASGVQSSHGEPFDGNIAVVIAAGDRTVEGRAEVLRIGERHLLDLLDLQDPLHVDPAMNRVRAALTVGYPDRLRLVFDHGFASAKLELGGLARLISIGELRGIPMGPIVDKFLAPILDPKDAP